MINARACVLIPCRQLGVSRYLIVLIYGSIVNCKYDLVRETHTFDGGLQTVDICAIIHDYYHTQLFIPVCPMQRHTAPNMRTDTCSTT